MLNLLHITIKSFIVRVSLLVSLFMGFLVQIQAQTIQPLRLLNHSLPDYRVWVTSVGYGLPDCNDCFKVHYGELYPLNMRESSTNAAIGPSAIKLMINSGVTGLQRLVLSNGGISAGDWLRGPLTEADAYPGFFVVPELQMQLGSTKEQALKMVESYMAEASKHTSAGKIGNKYIIATYGTMTLTPDDWQWVRKQTSAAGFNTYWLADVNGSFSLHSSFPRPQIISYFPAFEASYLFDDQTKYDSTLLALMNEFNRPFAGGFMPGYDRQTSLSGGYADAGGTIRLRQQLQLGLKEGLQWQTVNTWDDFVERTALWPSSNWNWTRADITAFYSTQMQGLPFGDTTPQLYITTPQYLQVGEAPQAEALVINPGSQTVHVTVALYDGNGQPFVGTNSAQVDPLTTGAANLQEANILRSLPARRYLKARAWLSDANGRQLQLVNSAPILVYEANDPNVAIVSYSSLHPVRREYYSIPAARALPGAVQISLSASPVNSPNTATATVTPPANITVRFAEVLQNTRQAKNMYNHFPYTLRIPMDSIKIIGGQQTGATAYGFYVARIIDDQERVAYSDPIYVEKNGSVDIPPPLGSSAGQIDKLSVYPNPSGSNVTVLYEIGAGNTATNKSVL